MTAAFPLAWPDTIPRSKAREKGQFRTSLAGALKNVETSVTAFGRDSGKAVASFVISSNVTLGAVRPHDPGVAIWFVWDGMQVCIPVDRYQTVEANLQAIHLIIEARRTELRHGTLALVRATFTGFLALPPGANRRHWRDVLGLNTFHKGIRNPVSRSSIEEAFRRLSKERHPDTPTGSHEAMAELNRARDEALAEVRI
ncbi:hypothetical protein SAMN05892877_103387 [Rhizobium subbaraonis]|uniref:J domain-containing protein n=1 Tax=Rhizobium subbaraonis TaxID=908946 RepID=A0A285U5Q3_9HYPH|nr:molecular chaperone DnaJ [Rhizobium subbaraonis]SOC37043.1 hypothetical protein SAMN05892877_103387 [Rhizobium subbaraonis]